MDIGTHRPSLVFSLLSANALVIILFILGHGSVMQVLWTYWLQSVLIGLINVIRILRQPQPGFGKVLFAGIFAFHYGFFHFTYAIFLSVFTLGNIFNLGSGHTSLWAILIGGFAFGIHHFISYLQEDPANDAAAVIAPYARIIPMHLTIILGPVISSRFGGSAVFVLFMGLKTFIDLRLELKPTSQQPAVPASPPSLDSQAQTSYSSPVNSPD